MTKKLLVTIVLLCFAVSGFAQGVNNRGVIVKDEGSNLGLARTIDIVGSIVSCGISGGEATCTFTAPSTTITSGSTATSGFTNNSLLATTSNLTTSGPKFLSGNLSLEVGVNYCPDAGSSDAYVCNLAGGALSAYTTGLQITLKANTVNTGTATIAVDGLTAKTITRSDGSTLVTGDITAAMPVSLVYDGTNFRVLSMWGRGSTGSGSFVLNTSPTIDGLTFGSANKATISGNYITMGQSDYGLAVNTTGGIVEATISWSSALSPTAPILASGSTSNSWHFAERADYLYNFQNPCLTGLGTVACTDPTLILHSAAQATNQALSLGHNQSQGVATANGGILARSLTYASGSDVALTVQGSLTGNIQNWKNSAGTTLGYIDTTGAHFVAGSATAAYSIGATIIPGSGSAAGGLKLGSYNANYGGFWSSNVTPAQTNYALISNGATTVINATSSIAMAISDATAFFSGTATGSTFRTPIISATTIPAVSNTSANSCGTSAATIAGTNETGIITVGATSGTSCTLTFAFAAPTRRQCIATNETSGLAVKSTYSSTTVSILAGTFAASDVIAYVCQVY